MDRLGLKLNQDKTVIRDAYSGNFDFLGNTRDCIWFRKDGTWYTGASPSKTSIKRLKQKVRIMLKPGEKGEWPDVRDRLNALLRGWERGYMPPRPSSALLVVLMDTIPALHAA